MRCIYKIINVVNNKFYVGSAVNFEKRKARHLWRLRRGDHINKHLQAAWTKYGAHAFVFAVVEEVPLDQDLLAVENEWLKQHVGQDYCYNIAMDATAPQRGMFGDKNSMWGRTFSHTPEAIVKIAAASSGRVQDRATVERKTAHLLGKPKSAAVRAKISATLSGAGNYWYGKERPDHGAKVSKAVEAHNPAGEVTIYPSIQALREALQMAPPTVNRALKSGKPLVRGPYKGWSFKYVDPTPGQ
jgi:group I intron endonuclease